MSSQASLNDIKENIRSILSTANASGASPVDLSNGLSNRVKSILKIHPAKIKIYALDMPSVTCYIDGKRLIGEDIAGAQSNALRQAEITIRIVGTIWNDNFSTNDTDPADNEIEVLMENIEQIIRHNTKLGGTVLWTKFDSTEYFEQVLEEQTHLRSGLLTLTAKVAY